jgi:hypothetical protein
MNNREAANVPPRTSRNHTHFPDVLARLAFFRFKFELPRLLGVTDGDGARWVAPIQKVDFS